MKYQRKKQLLLDNSAVALILILWVLVFLSIIAAEFAFFMRVEVNTTKNFIDAIKSYYFAQAAIQRAIAEIYAPNLKYNYIDPHGKLAFVRKDLKTGEEVGKTAPNRENIKFADGVISYRIEDEESKVNINKANEKTLKKLLSLIGMEEGVRKDTIVDSILDWRDRDHEHRINGAENDYYENLPNPYKCKDGPFDSIEELLLVRGVTKEILYGSSDKERYKGLYKYITIRNKGINKNTASEIVLKACLDEKSAIIILEKRKENSGIYSETQKSYNFTVKAEGKTNSNFKRVIKALISRKVKGKVAEISIIYWNSNFIK